MAALIISGVSFNVGMSAFRSFYGNAFHGSGAGVVVGGFPLLGNIGSLMVNEKG
jgi:hypothetical protein